jgi:hypothetical protein
VANPVDRRSRRQQTDAVPDGVGEGAGKIISLAFIVRFPISSAKALTF